MSVRSLNKVMLIGNLTRDLICAILPIVPLWLHLELPLIALGRQLMEEINKKSRFSQRGSLV
jgi:hypothetical protein